MSLWDSFGFWESLADLERGPALIFFLALAIAFGFEFINGFHDTANAVATVIYTRTLNPTVAVFFSGFCNFLGVLLGGTAVAFGIVNLLPVDLLVDPKSNAALVMVFSLLIAGVAWNLGTWYLGLPVSSSHTLIGSILGVGLANCFLSDAKFCSIRWDKVLETGLALLCSPLIGFLASYLVLRVAKMTLKDPRLYVPPVDGEKPPGWMRWTLIGTCGGVSFTHGSNDGQKGMGLLLLVLVGFLPFHYALDTFHAYKVEEMRAALPEVPAAVEGVAEKFPKLPAKLAHLSETLDGIHSFKDVPNDKRWEVRTSIFTVSQALKEAKAPKELREKFTNAIEFVPFWVVFCTAVALGLGTTVGYKRIVVTVAEKIGNKHLTYAQGAAAQAVTAGTILMASLTALPVSTTQVLSSGVAGTMAANNSGIQGATARRILLAWVCTLPCTMLMAGGLFAIGKWLFV